MKQTYRSVLLGLGNIAWKMAGDAKSGESLSHAAAYANNPNIELVAGCSPDSKDNELFQGKFTLPVYDELSDMLEEQKPDIVSVCSPTAFHFEQMYTLLTECVPMIWLEKPPAETAEQIQQLINKNSGESNSTILVNYQRRYTESYQKLRQVIHSRQFGDAKYMEIRYSKGLVVNGMHMLDMVFYILGDQDYELLWVENNNDSNPSFALRFSSGIRVIINGCDLPYHNIDIIVTCQNARFSILHGGMTVKQEEKIEHELFPGFYRLSEIDKCILGKGRFDYSYDKALQDLVLSHEAGDQPMSNLETSLHSQMLIDRVAARNLA